MSKVRIKIAFLGHVQHNISKEKILRWKSSLFLINAPIDTYTINNNSDIDDWSYSDVTIQNELPTNFDGDILIAITNVPIEDNYFARRLTNNRLCLSLHEMSDILKLDNIPLENLIFRVCYALSLIFKECNKLPTIAEYSKFTHDETKGCIFDMNGIKTDIIYSTNKPILCDSCKERLKKVKIESNLIDDIQSELNKINKTLYYRITDFVKKEPVWSILISSLAAIVLGTIGSLVASVIFEKIK